MSDLIHMATAFEKGIRESANDNLHQISENVMITTLHSPWLHSRCKKCDHTFRIEDRVRVNGDEVLHDTALLQCAEPHGEKEENLEESTKFYKGMDETWPPPENLQLTRLTKGHPLLAPPFASFKRMSCAVCGHTLREGDVVVICPCSPKKPKCQIAIHRDLLHGLNCWNDWNPGSYLTHCPATSKRLYG